MSYDCTTLDDLWIIDAKIPLKDGLLVEMVRVVLWIAWLNRTFLCFSQTPTSLRKIGAQMISLITFWCKTQSENLFADLGCLMPLDITSLSNQLHTGQMLVTENPRD